MKKERKHYTGEEKVAILRRHLLDKVPVSDLCDELGLQPTVFYRWQKEFFENGAAVFQGKSRPDHQAEQQGMEFLEKKVQTKDEVLAEMMAEHDSSTGWACGPASSTTGEKAMGASMNTTVGFPVISSSRRGRSKRSSASTSNIPGKAIGD